MQLHYWSMILIMKALYLFIFMLTSSCIIMAPRRGNDDMFSQQELSSEKYKIRFIEVTAEEVIQKGKPQVYLFASWCPFSLAHLRQVKATEAKSTIFVSSNYDCKSMNRLFRNAIDTIYILSNTHYGSNESLKIKQFASELLGMESELTGVPQQFMKKSGKYIRLVSNESPDNNWKN